MVTREDLPRQEQFYAYIQADGVEMPSNGDEAWNLYRVLVSLYQVIYWFNFIKIIFFRGLLNPFVYSPGT